MPTPLGLYSQLHVPRKNKPTPFMPTAELRAGSYHHVVTTPASAAIGGIHCQHCYEAAVHLPCGHKLWAIIGRRRSITTRHCIESNMKINHNRGRTKHMEENNQTQ